MSLRGTLWHCTFCMNKKCDASIYIYIIRNTWDGWWWQRNIQFIRNTHRNNNKDICAAYSIKWGSGFVAHHTKNSYQNKKHQTSNVFNQLQRARVETLYFINTIDIFNLCVITSNWCIRHISALPHRETPLTSVDKNVARTCVSKPIIIGFIFHHQSSSNFTWFKLVMMFRWAVRWIWKNDQTYLTAHVLFVWGSVYKSSNLSINAEPISIVGNYSQTMDNDSLINFFSIQDSCISNIWLPSVSKMNSVLMF